MNKMILSLFLALCSMIILAPVAVQITNFQDGNVLTAGQLNNEFGNIYSTINNLDEDNFSPTAALPPSIIDSSIAGAGISRDPVTGVLSIQVDDTTIELNVGVLQLKDDGVSTAKIQDNAINADKIATNAVGSDEIATNAVGNTEIATDAVRADEIQANAVGASELANNAVDTAAIQNDAVTKGKLTNISVASGSGNENNVVYSSAISGTINFLGGAGTVTGPTATLTTTGRPIMVQLSPAFGQGPAFFRCGNVGVQDIRVILKVDGSEVARWTFDFGITVGGAGFDNLHDFYRPFTYIDGRVAGTYDYRYDIQMVNGPSLVDVCTYNNWAVAVFEI